MSDLLIPSDFPLILAAYTAQRDAAVGIDWDTQEIKALYGVARESMAGEIVRNEMIAVLRIKIDQAWLRFEQLKSTIQGAQDKEALLHEAKNIEQVVMLATAMIEHLEEYDRA